MSVLLECIVFAYHEFCSHVAPSLMHHVTRHRHRSSRAGKIGCTDPVHFGDILYGKIPLHALWHHQEPDLSSEKTSSRQSCRRPVRYFIDILIYGLSRNLPYDQKLPYRLDFVFYAPHIFTFYQCCFTQPPPQYHLRLDRLRPERYFNDMDILSGLMELTYRRKQITHHIPILTTYLLFTLGLTTTYKLQPTHDTSTHDQYAYKSFAEHSKQTKKIWLPT